MDINEIQLQRLNQAMSKYVDFIFQLDNDEALTDAQKVRALSLTRAISCAASILVEGKQIDARERYAMARAKMTDEVAYKVEMAKAQARKIADVKQATHLAASGSLRKKLSTKEIE